MRRIFLLATGLAAVVASQASAHARLKPTGTIKPRSDASGLKTGPCGDVPVDEAKRVTLEARSQLTVEWEETINHPGSFKISFSENGTSGFDEHLLKEVQDVQDGPVTFDDPATYHQYSTSVEVPDITCDKCTFQLIQVMTDRNPPTFYYSCADVRITGGAVTADPGTSTTTSTSTATSGSTSTKTDTQTSTSTNGSSDKPGAPTNLEVKVKGKAASGRSKDEDAGEGGESEDGGDTGGDTSTSSLAEPDHDHAHGHSEGAEEVEP